MVSKKLRARARQQKEARKRYWERYGKGDHLTNAIVMACVKSVQLEQSIAGKWLKNVFDTAGYPHAPQQLPKSQVARWVEYTNKAAAEHGMTQSGGMQWRLWNDNQYYMVWVLAQHKITEQLVVVCPPNNYNKGQPTIQVFEGKTMDGADNTGARHVGSSLLWDVRIVQAVFDKIGKIPLFRETLVDSPVWQMSRCFTEGTQHNMAERFEEAAKLGISIDEYIATYSPDSHANSVAIPLPLPLPLPMPAFKLKEEPSSSSSSSSRKRKLPPSSSSRKSPRLMRTDIHTVTEGLNPEETAAQGSARAAALPEAIKDYETSPKEEEEEKSAIWF